MLDEPAGSVTSAYRWALLIGVLALTSGLLIGVLVIPPLAPPMASAPASTRSVAGVQRAFDDSRTVAATPSLTAEVTVLAGGASGTVTASSCVPGVVVVTGGHLFSVNGRPVIAMVSSVPLWRDLSLGIRGPDVQGVQEALTAVGFPVAASGTYDRNTASAVRRMQEAAQVAGSGQITIDQVQWIPRDAGAVSSCEVGVGAVVSAGQPLLKVGGGLVALSLPAQAGLLADRAYVAVAGEIAATVPEDGRITDAGLLTAVSASEAFAAWKRDPATGVAIALRLAEPIAALGLPPSAVLLTDAEKGCMVTAEGATVPAEVLASELGTVFVVPERAVDEVVIPAAEVIDECG